MTTKIPAVTLNNGVEMPILGFGVFQVPDPAECERSVRDAIDVGYRLLDTAASYGNEEAAGRRDPGPRHRPPRTVRDHQALGSGRELRRREGAFERSLNKLQLDYLDLWLIHQPYGDVYGAWRAMEELHRAGRIRAIGVSNFYPDRLVDFVLHNESRAGSQPDRDPSLPSAGGRARAILNEYKVQPEAWGRFAGGQERALPNGVLQIDRSEAWQEHRAGGPALADPAGHRRHP